MSALIFRIKNRIIITNTIFLVFVLLYSFFSKASAFLYSPGTTPEPDCPPTESLLTCGIVAPPSSIGSVQNLTLARIRNSTFSTMQEIQNVFPSAGWTSGDEITDAGGGAINFVADTGLIRSANSVIEQYK